MAQTESQLEIYKIILGKKTIREIIREKENITSENACSDADLFKKLYEKLLVKLTNSVAWTSDKTKLGLALFSNAGEGVNNILTSHFEKNVIEGFIDGGPYDKIRTIAQVSNVTERRKLEKDKMLTDRYYIYLYLPLGSKIGLLLLERKKGQNIHIPIEILLKELFRTSKRSGITIERFVPETIIDEYKNGSRVEDFTFTDNITTSVNDEEGTNQEESIYGVSIRITPPTSEQPSYDLFQSVLQSIGNSSIKFGDTIKHLSDFVSKKGGLKKDDKKYTFVIGNDLKIKPMIPIADEYQDSENEVLNRASIKTMCDEVLEQIQDDIYVVS